MKVMNQFGRIMEMTREDFDKMIANGVNLQIIERELVEIPDTETVVYTAIAGDYKMERKDIVCFGDEKIFREPVMEAKRYKILPHLFFPKSEYTIWTDANIYLKKEANYLIGTMLGDADMALFKHSYRHGVYDEFAELRKDPRFNIPYLQGKMAVQEAEYQKEGMPNLQLFECNFLIRRNNYVVNKMNNAWWAEICRHSWRDQLSLPYVLWKYGKDVKLRQIEGNIRNHKFFKYISMYD